MQNHIQPPSTTTVYCILAASFLALLLILYLPTSHPPHSPPSPDPSLFPNHPHRLLFHHHPTNSSSFPNPSLPTPPSIAYLISGSAGDSDRILRLLFAVYHPKNHYLLHLDLSAPQSDRDSLAFSVQSVPIFRAARNVDVIGKADFAYPKGSSSISSILHGASILLRISSSWDWFINLSVADYPLVTQDDLLHILSYLPKDLNFVKHTSYIGWKESRRLKWIVVDPGLYLSEKSEIFYATQKRELPDAYRLFMTSSSSHILSRKFMEFCILGTDNLPRTLLMYLSNTLSSQSTFFPTVLCNSRQFNRTVINESFHYSLINSTDLNTLIHSGSIFGSLFPRDHPLLDRIDNEILFRSPGKPVQGGWCLGVTGIGMCDVWGDADVLRPGSGASRLEKRVVGLLSNGTFRAHQCLFE